MAASSDVLVRVSGDLSDFNSTLGGLGEGLISAVSGLNPILAGVAAATIGIGVAAFNASTEFNASMANIATLIPNNTERVNELKASVQDLAIQTGKSTKDISGGLYEVISTFGDTADSVKILEIAAKSGAAGLSTTQEALKLTAAWTKSYGDTSAEAVQASADLSFQIVNLGQTTMPELAASIGRVLPLAATMKVSQQEVAAVMATATGVTGTAAEVSTQLRGVIQSLMAPTKEMSALIRDSGYASGEALIKQEGLKGAIDLVVGASESSGVPLQKFMGSIEGQTLALTLAGNSSEKYTQNLTAMGSVAGATDTAFREQTEGVNAIGFAWQQLQVHLGVLAERIGDFLAPAFTLFVDTIGAVVEGLDFLTSSTTYSGESFGGLLDFLQPVADFFTNTVAPVLLDVTAFLTGLGVVIWDAVKPALVALWEPLKMIGGIIRDVVLVQIDLLFKGLGLIMDALKAIPGVSSLFEKGMAVMAGSAKDATTATKQATTEVANLAKAHTETASTLTSKSTPAFKSTTAALKEQKQAKAEAKKEAEALEKAQKLVADMNKRLAHETKEAAKEAEKHAKEFEKLVKQGADLKITFDPIPPLIGDMKLAMADLSGTIDEATRKAWDGERALKEMGITPISELQNLATQAETNFNKIKDSGVAGPPQIEQAWVNMLNARKAALEAQGQTLPQEEQKMLDALLQKQKDFKDNSTGTSGVFTEWANGIKSLTGNLGTDMVKQLFTDPGSFGGSLKDKLNAIKGSFLDTFTNQIGGVIDDFIQKGLNAVMGALDGIIGKLTGTGGLQSAISTVFGAGTDAAGNAVGGAVGAGGGAASGVGSAAGGASSLGMSLLTGGMAMAGGIIGGVLNMRQEGTLNACELSLRIIAATLNGGGYGGASGPAGGMTGILHDMHGWAYQQQGWYHGAWVELLNNVGDWGIIARLDMIAERLGELLDVVPRGLERIADRVPHIVTNVYLDSEQIAARVEQRIEYGARLQTA